MNIFKRLNTSLHRAYYKNMSPTRHKISNVMGAEFVMRPDNYIDRRIWIDGIYEKKQIAFLFEKIRKRPFDLFIDIGANFGLYSCILGKNKMVDHIHSFECDPRNIYHLHGHIYMNGLMEDITVHPYALGDQNNEVVFGMAPSNNTGKSSVQNIETANTTIKVQQKRLDDVLTVRDQTLLIKIDVEGHERAVLNGMSALLRNNKALLQIEILADSQPVHDVLGAWGYQAVHRIDQDFYFTNMSL